MKRVLVTGVIAMLTVVGCGGPKNKLTDEQKKNFADIMESTGRSQQVAKQAQRNSPSQALQRSTSLPPDQQMLAKLRAGQCRYQVTTPKKFDEGGAFTSGPIEQGFSVEGDGCPIQLSFAVKSELTQTDFTVNLDMSYSVNDDEYKKLNDVYAFRLKGEAKADRSGGRGDFSGAIGSQKYGDVPMVIKLSGDKDQMEWIYSFDVPNMPVEIRVVQKAGGALEITRNGETLTKAEFQALMNKGGDAFAPVTPEAGSRQAE